MSPASSFLNSGNFYTHDGIVRGLVAAPLQGVIDGPAAVMRSCLHPAEPDARDEDAGGCRLRQTTFDRVRRRSVQADFIECIARLPDLWVQMRVI